MDLTHCKIIIHSYIFPNLFSVFIKDQYYYIKDKNTNKFLSFNEQQELEYCNEEYSFIFENNLLKNLNGKYVSHFNGKIILEETINYITQHFNICPLINFNNYLDLKESYHPFTILIDFEKTLSIYESLRLFHKNICFTHFDKINIFQKNYYDENILYSEDIDPKHYLQIYYGIEEPLELTCLKTNSYITVTDKLKFAIEYIKKYPQSNIEEYKINGGFHNIDSDLKSKFMAIILHQCMYSDYDQYCFVKLICQFKFLEIKTKFTFKLHLNNCLKTLNLERINKQIICRNLKAKNKSVNKVLENTDLIRYISDFMFENFSIGIFYGFEYKKYYLGECDIIFIQLLHKCELFRNNKFFTINNIQEINTLISIYKQDCLLKNVNMHTFNSFNIGNFLFDIIPLILKNTFILIKIFN